MASLAALQRKLDEPLQHAPDAAISYKEFGALSKHEKGQLQALFDIIREATGLGTREEELQFFGLYVQTASSWRETLLPSTCKAYQLSDGEIYGAGLKDDISQNLRHRGKHSARSAWVRAPLLHAPGISVPPSTFSPGGLCLDCAGQLGGEPAGQCLVCERGVHLACIAEKLDPDRVFAEDPYIFCARCYTEAYDEVLAFRVLGPYRQALVLDTDEAWGSSSTSDVFQTHVLPAVAAQPDVHHLSLPYTPPTPAGVTPLAAARSCLNQAVPGSLVRRPELAVSAPRFSEPVGETPEQADPIILRRCDGRPAMADDQVSELLNSARSDPATQELRQAVELLQLQLQ